MRKVSLSLALVAAFLAGPGRTQTPEYPTPDTTQEIGDWLLECFEAPLEQCQIYQRILLNDGAAIALVAAFAWDSEREVLRAQIALPLGIDLQREATISSSSGYSVKAPFSRCTQQGCLIEGVVPDEMVAAFARSTGAQIAVFIPDRGEFEVPLSLDGFTAALAQISPELPANAPLPATPIAPELETGSTETQPDARFAPVTGE